MKFVTLADIHWRGLTRHEEYTKVFNELFRQLREEIKPDYIVGLGDYFHSKLQNITPEVIDKITWMFDELAKIAPVYAILGNHDGNLTNKDRLNTISPIVAAMNNPRITLFKNSGNHIIEGTNVNLCVLSCLDEPGWNHVETDDDLINIALFHGPVEGCLTDEDWVVKDNTNPLSMFEKYDFAFLGDIHKFQYLAERKCNTGELKPWIGYGGSCTQQNYGESTVKGYLVWDIKSVDDWDVEFIQVPNDHQFITVNWQGDVQSTVAEALSVGAGTLVNKRIRISSNQTVFHLQMKELYDELKGGTYKASEVVFKADKKNEYNKTDISKKKSTLSLRNGPDSLCALYEAFIHDTAIPLSGEQIKQAQDYIREALEKVKINEDESARDIVWSIKDLEFSNLYRFGEGNRIKFSNLSGITGIFSPNRTGKSSVIGSLMFGLFNTTDRGPVKSAYVINKSKGAGSVKVTINVSGVDYVIERSAQKTVKRGGRFDEEKAATKLTLSRANEAGNYEEIVCETGESRTDTDKAIRKLIGTSQDFLLTALSPQGGMNKFIDEGATQRKSILNRFLDLDIFEKLFAMAKEEFSGYNARTTKFRNMNWTEARSKYETEISSCNNNITELQAELEKNKTEQSQLRIWLQQHGLEKQTELRQTISTTKKSIADLEKTISALETGCKTNKQTCSDLDIQIKADEAALKEQGSLNNLEQKQAEFQKLGDEYTALKNKLSNAEQKLESQEKSIKKLDLVPCGTTFPGCHYIKDSIMDKAEFHDQRSLVEKILKSYKDIKKEFEDIQQQKIEESICVYTQTQQRIEQSQLKLDLLKSITETNENHLRSFKQQLKTDRSQHDSLLLELDKQDDLGTKEDAEKNLETVIKTLENKLQRLYQTLGAASNKLESLIKESKEAEEIIEEQKVYDSVMQAFSKNGIPAYVLKNQLPQINAELDAILAGSVPFRIFLETEAEINALDIFIEDKNSRRVIEVASGMEKMIASLAIRVALISLSSLPKPDIFIMDEGLTALDDANLGNVLELLQSIKSRFKSILIISHVEEIKEAANTILSIYDNGTESSIYVC